MENHTVNKGITNFVAKEKSRNRVTIREVAEDAGVSVAAVSKVLRNAYGVSDKLRANVQRSVEKLGYRPLAAARAMRGQTFTLGVIFPDIRNPFFPDILAGVNSALERTPYQAMLGISQTTNWVERSVIDSMFDRQMDGLIIIGSTEDPEELAEIGRRKPLVAIAHHGKDAIEFDTVNDDDHLGGELAVKHLVGNGYERISMLNLQVVSATSHLIEREAGYRAAMNDAGLSKHINVIHANQTLRETQIVARRILESRNRPEALFCWTDIIALEVIGVATEMGLRIPEDIAIVGYDNTMFCELAQNALTSVDQSGEVLGLQAARLVIERIKGRKEPEHFVITPRIVARNSSARTK